MPASPQVQPPTPHRRSSAQLNNPSSSRAHITTVAFPRCITARVAAVCAQLPESPSPCCCLLRAFQPRPPRLPHVTTNSRRIGHGHANAPLTPSHAVPAQHPT